MRRPGLPALLLLLVAAPAAAQLTGEHLAAPADATMQLGFAHGAPAPIQEYVARGETVEDWTRMVTVQQLGWRPGMTPAVFGARFIGLMLRACPGGVAAPLVPATLPGEHAATDLRFDCPRNPQTGKPETMLGRIVLGDQAMHMVQAALRRTPSASDVAWARGVVTGAVLCAADSPAPRCAASVSPAPGTAL